MPSDDASQPQALKKRGPDWWMITPMVFTMLPLIRIGFRHNPKLRDRLFFGAIGVGLVHGTWLILRANENAAEAVQEVYYTPPHKTVAARTLKPATPQPAADGAAAPAVPTPTASKKMA